MTEVTLTGKLVCASPAEAEVVEDLLPHHVLSTRAEPGCLLFEVTRRGSSLVWDVTERFENADAFRAHQARVAESAWGSETAAIQRDYAVTGLNPG
ncbi:putative quinol monooxygenase [Microbacterium invictum]|uniref:Quinol monooxygenase YgiN n=1 Tax=Microbacterium invictum TaxID=515415 RepID=A0AA40SR35_9MICO|nr:MULTISPECIES: antibiotic biosynthesis monooxygenase [Microbacterium]MBB4140769.1 quinol monooxygenase YgiN [Microbacterium invictum]